MRNINVKIMDECKARIDNFKAWLKWNHPGTAWDQNNTMDEIISDSDVWRDYLKEEHTR